VSVPSQLALGVELRTSCRLESFVAPRGHPVLAALRGLIEGGTHRHVFIQGPLGSGKSHLLQALCNARASERAIYLPLTQRTGWSPSLLAGFSGLDLICVDDVHDIAADADWERAMFNLFNDADASACRLLMASRQPPSVLAMPDLRSRLQSMLLLTLGSPDDALKARIDSAAAFVPLERLCLSPQCGFASADRGTHLRPSDQEAKLALVVATAADVWGE